ncbi:intercompartmental signaling factor BofC [Bacillus sp. DTU_2020_1000418_1_SI_GHA_SEK_038]|uniref:intercompartmental signaling factor BofC n=1 Tax=Bacillus sp. DTU_2020_1000418_1_SI_GHA_SEK_038 TaxID=3077585 RepID=UPI0028E435DB|nr:intercompartmental signaling factor BofC [Bacillus sp. DTU_2020_1000418_1_SI_GHA_SEK_038]WNS74434.1 intercompartmental signaling factor BofC [Bacillus sp. DTU_2020_1000418_1_SI_GHA_SEK_038]
MRTNWSIALCFATLILFQYAPINGLAEDNRENNNFATLDEPLHITVVLERMYLDGEASQELLTETIWSMEEFWAKYDEWQLIDMEEEKMIFRKYIDDISPLLKANGYFGITDKGVLTIFNGRPHKSNIIQSFFQIDLGRLESKKCEELKKGIPIKTKEQFVEVLETFKFYSKVEKQAN